MIDRYVTADADGLIAGLFSRAVPSTTDSRSRRPTPLALLSASHPDAPALKRASIEETRRHARRLASFSTALGRHINLPEDQLNVLRVGSLLHDVGKNAMPPQVLFKRGPLTAEEFAVIQYHPIIGDMLCARVPALAAVRPVVRHHHERLDGSGYPDGVRGNAISLLAQIVGIVDVYDALVCARPYKPAYDPSRALSILRREVELGWRSPYLVAAWMEVVEVCGVQPPMLD